jgi:hypothetical protein
MFGHSNLILFNILIIDNDALFIFNGVQLNGHPDVVFKHEKQKL